MKKFRWKDEASKQLWYKSIKDQFKTSHHGIHDIAPKLMTADVLECTFSNAWPEDVEVVNGMSEAGVFLFVRHDIKNFLVEVTEPETSERWFKWKNSDSPVLWKERTYNAFRRGNWRLVHLEELDVTMDKIHRMNHLCCEVGNGKYHPEGSIIRINGMNFHNQILFLPSEIEEYLVECESKEVIQSGIKQVDSMPKSGIFTAVWIEDGFLKSEDFFADGDKVKLQRMDMISVPRDELVNSFPKQTVFMVME